MPLKHLDTLEWSLAFKIHVNRFNFFQGCLVKYLFIKTFRQGKGATEIYFLEENRKFEFKVFPFDLLLYRG